MSEGLMMMQHLSLRESGKRFVSNFPLNSVDPGHVDSFGLLRSSYVTHHRCVPASGVTQQQSGVRRRDETLPAERCAQQVQGPRGAALATALTREKTSAVAYRIASTGLTRHARYDALITLPRPPSEGGCARAASPELAEKSAVVGNIFQFWASPDQRKPP